MDQGSRIQKELNIHDTGTGNRKRVVVMRRLSSVLMWPKFNRATLAATHLSIYFGNSTISSITS